ncbi:SURF1 family protein [Vibrio sp. JPW-9-11-11]|uniref:SURF1 family protein n=1 Tax=Vibrio sp. JPW-9-11-11 TaxID=1416532 RepID=UPI0020CEF0AD|nr:SURF1 family protein [Vibrio sp. JPW-9-11-11]
MITLRFVGACLLTVVAFLLLINLGLWQLSRADEKTAIEQRVSDRENLHPLALSELKHDQLTQPTGLRVRFSATPIEGKYLLLDNQNFAGEVGYLALQLMRTEANLWVLLERGFVVAPSTRAQLPTVKWLKEPLKGVGRIYRKSLNPLSQDLFIERGEIGRIQNLNIAQLEREWQIDIEPYVIQPLYSDWPYPQPWQPVSMNAEKHLGYAFQWFSMAFALAVLSLFLLVRTLKQGASHD